MATIAQPPYWGSVLRSGSAGPDVSLVQRWLNNAHDRWPAIRRVAVDGRYGEATTAAVKTFQLLSGLSDDGHVGAETWNALYAQHAQQTGSGEIYPGTAMRSGSSGATVKSAQTILKDTVPSLNADGRFGPATKRAVEIYQLTHNLNADGVIGPATWASLYGRT